MFIFFNKLDAKYNYRNSYDDSGVDDYSDYNKILKLFYGSMNAISLKNMKMINVKNIRDNKECEKAISKDSYVVKYCLNKYEIEEMCKKADSKDPFTLKYCSCRYNTRKV